MTHPRVIGVLLCGVVVAGLIATALAHPGGLDANGGHRNRKTGEYHIHRSPRATESSQAAEAKTVPDTSSSLAGQAGMLGSPVPAPVRDEATITAKKLDALVDLLTQKGVLSEVDRQLVVTAGK